MERFSVHLHDSFFLINCLMFFIPRNILIISNGTILSKNTLKADPPTTEIFFRRKTARLSGSDFHASFRSDLNTPESKVLLGQRGSLSICQVTKL